MSAIKANETVYASNLGSPNTRNSLKADIGENQHIIALEIFEKLTNCLNVKKYERYSIQFVVAGEFVIAFGDETRVIDRFRHLAVRLLNKSFCSSINGEGWCLLEL